MKNRLNIFLKFIIFVFLSLGSICAIAQDWAILTTDSVEFGIAAPSVLQIKESLKSAQTFLNSSALIAPEDPIAQMWNLGLNIIEELNSQNSLANQEQIQNSIAFIPWKKGERNIDGDQLDLYLYRNWRLIHEKQKKINSDNQNLFYSLGTVVNFKFSNDESFLEIQLALGLNPLSEAYRRELGLVNLESFQIQKAKLGGETTAVLLTLYFDLDKQKLQQNEFSLKKALLKIQFGMLEGIKIEASNSYFKVHEDNFLACSRKRSVPIVHTKDAIFNKLPIDVLFYGALFQVTEESVNGLKVEVLKARAGMAPFNLGCLETGLSNWIFEKELNRIIQEDTKRFSNLIYILTRGTAEETANFVEKEKVVDGLSDFK